MTDDLQDNPRCLNGIKAKRKGIHVDCQEKRNIPTITLALIVGMLNQ